MIMIEIGSGDTGIDHALGHKVDPEIAVHGLDQDLGIVKEFSVFKLTVRRSLKSKRTSGFDMAPPGAAVVTASAIPGSMLNPQTGVLPSTAAGAGSALSSLGQIPGMGQPLPGVFPSMFPFAGGTQADTSVRWRFAQKGRIVLFLRLRRDMKFGGLSAMPVQALTQQVCSSASTIYLPGQLTRGDFWIIQTGSPPISFVWMEDPVLHTFVALTEVATRHARRVYVGGLPPMANEQSVATFFSQVMAAVGGNTAGPGDAVVNVYINQEKRFAFVEMRTVEEASNAMALDGIIYEGVSVRVRRPSDYNPSMAATLGPSQPSPHLNLAAVGLTPGASGGADGPDRIFVGGLPYYLSEEQIMDLLSSFGPLRAFDLVKDRDTGNSKGYGFCVYQDPSVMDIACAALNGLKMGDRTLTVRRASASGQPKPDQANVLVQAQQQIALQIFSQKLALQASGANAVSLGSMGMAAGMIPGMGSSMMSGMLPGMGVMASEVPTRVVCLSQLSGSALSLDTREAWIWCPELKLSLHLSFWELISYQGNPKVVSPDELKEDNEYEEILEDMKEECGKYGTLTNLVIPRPSSSGEEVPGIGMVFVEYIDTQGSAKAKATLHGRRFGGHTVIATYYPEEKFTHGDYGG
ncbi:hypothetical protein AXG93_131s1180 [Marchantia polymorpha subsp. ruderalis]|uniref:RRM domain-containing protein n=1 Tax=Marchantia polymorpha subsp. ruderalis TaxID=1480154 RepID=A0A176W013_MARPO|nr:hypothetical protein AXG93_131s1180 [Marchantia polymorpha subsp. ruderalis]